MKIGVLTHFYGTMNYGGVLQAYALITVLRKMGCDAEQISYKFWELFELSEERIGDYDPTLARIPADTSRFFAGTKAADARYERLQAEVVVPRKKKFADFRLRIPHSEKVYGRNTVFLTNELYDGFIVGSDQVWNLKWHSSAFFLEFADPDKRKLAYAASAGASEFDAVQRKYLARVLPRFDAVSVREQDMVKPCRELSGKNVENTLDPVLLLDREDWDRIAAPRLVREKYVFCFFYHPTEKVYTLAKDYAKCHGLKIVTIPYAFCDTDIHLDDSFGDYRMATASPEDFISLIEHADCVFSDSFHAVVYSMIYKRQVFAFRREWSRSEWRSDMSARIYTLMDIFSCKEHFCDSPDKLSLDYIQSLKPIDYSEKNSRFEQMKRDSLIFLRKNI